MIVEFAPVLGGLVTGVGGILAAGLLSRRKRRADAVQVLTQAAAQMVEPLSRQIAAMNAELDEHRRVVAAAEERCRRASSRHTSWDHEVRFTLLQLGVDVPPPPPVDED
ncbi:hypothetical protein [Nocardia donostiensis]|uniref:Uncharacterized protein n=1 Tax=Nocardia donostiensis TaxID=1538463 RepID=A0A1W0BG81_9NOCA|nr:hypothetical protein [Nocardia donostiensis]ONM47964.1 hypothetical protein B0T46_15115 [Nocardia donostiensis]OQS13123.1 hypothetical protein B0T36_21505 [Nocardia donostiensis]OQS21507.1 hypothetical protein B0T44_07720 [Nocardia donostiensis]